MKELQTALGMYIKRMIYTYSGFDTAWVEVQTMAIWLCVSTEGCNKINNQYWTEPFFTVESMIAFMQDTSNDYKVFE